MTYVQQKICPKSDKVCAGRAALLRSATYLDVDFDAISQSLVLTAFYSSSPDFDGWTEKISRLDYSAKVEVGVLAPESPQQPEELSLGGFLLVLGEDLKASMSDTCSFLEGVLFALTGRVPQNLPSSPSHRVIIPRKHSKALTP